jgi:hypothetical protein
VGQHIENLESVIQELMKTQDLEKPEKGPKDVDLVCALSCQPRRLNRYMCFGAAHNCCMLACARHTDLEIKLVILSYSLNNVERDLRHY